MRFIINSFGSLGDLNPYLGLGRALQARGHDVVLAVPGLYVAYAEAAGLKAQAVRPDIDPDARDVVRKIMDPFRGAEYLIRDLMMPNVEAAYRDLDALVRDDDVLVSHPLTYAAPVLAERRGLRWASTVLAPLGFFSRKDAPLMAVHPVMEAVQRHLPGFYNRLVPLARVATKRWSPQVAALRQKLGLPSGEDPVHAGQFSPHLNLAMFSPLLAPPQDDWPRNTVVTGAVSYDAVHGSLPRHLEEFLDAGTRPIAFTLGSSAVASRQSTASVPVGNSRQGLSESASQILTRPSSHAVTNFRPSPRNIAAFTSPGCTNRFTVFASLSLISTRNAEPACQVLARFPS